MSLWQRDNTPVSELKENDSNMDYKIQTILRNEKHRQDNTVELIASENFASNAVMELSGSIFTNKYAEGLPGKRYYNGCDEVDKVEELAIEYATSTDFNRQGFIW